MCLVVKLSPWLCGRHFTKFCHELDYKLQINLKKNKVVLLWKVITVKILLNLILTICSNCQILLTFHYCHYAQCNHVHYVQTGLPGSIWYKVIHLTGKQLLYCFDFYFKEICLYLVLLLWACVTAVNAISVNPCQKYYKYLRVCYKRTVIFP